MWYDRYRPKSSVPGHWRKEVHLACLASQRYKGWQRHNERDDINVTTSHWTWQRNIALTTLNCNRQNLKVSSALLCTLLLQLQHAWSLGWFLPFEAQKSWDFLWSSMIRKPGSTCFFSLQFFTSAFNILLFYPLKKFEFISIWGEELTTKLPCLLPWTWMAALLILQDDEKMQTDMCRHIIQIDFFRSRLLSEKEWKLLTSWKRPKTPGDVSPPGSGILYGWCLQLGQVLLVAFGRCIAGSFCMLLWFGCFRGLNARYIKTASSA